MPLHRCQQPIRVAAKKLGEASESRRDTAKEKTGVAQTAEAFDLPVKRTAEKHGVGRRRLGH